MEQGEKHAGKCAHGHDSFQRDIDNTAPFREHGAQSHDHKRNHEIHGLLKDKINYTHASPPPFVCASSFSWRAFCTFPISIFTMRAKALK